MNTIYFNVGEPLDSPRNKTVPCPDDAHSAAMVIALSFIHYKQDYSNEEAEEEANADCREICIKVVDFVAARMEERGVATLNDFKAASKAVFESWMEKEGARLLNWGANRDTITELGKGMHNLMTMVVMSMGMNMEGQTH